MNKPQKNIRPPKLAERFLIWFLKRDLAEEVLGDLDEKFYSVLDRSSVGRAKRNYWLQVFNYLRPFALRAFSNNNKGQNILAMFKHNILISYRSFMRFKGTFLINLIGLASGLACTLLIYLWVADELKTDRFHTKGDRIYQVLKHLRRSAVAETQTYTPRALSAALKEEFPEIEMSISVNQDWAESPGIAGFGEKKLKATDNQIDPDFFKIFSYKLLEGNVENPVPNTRSVLISDEFATKLFGSSDDVVGKVLNWQQEEMSGDYLITGLFQAPPTYSSKAFDLLFSMDLLAERYHGYVSWNNNNEQTYLLLKEGTDAAALNSKIEFFLKTKNSNTKHTLSLQKFEDRYLYGSYTNAEQTGGRIVYVRLFSLVALFILGIACINFMNLTTAKASNRMKEIGVKKAIGAGRRSLVAQYLSESLLLSFLAAFIALALATALLGRFNQITGKQLTLDLDLPLFTSLAVITILTGLAAGSYPALYLSGLHPIAMLKGKMKQTFGDAWLRKGLVIVQFTISAVLITAVMVISEQINYIQSKNLGFNRENLLRFDYVIDDANAYSGFVQELKSVPGVLNVAGAIDDATGVHGGTGNVSWPLKEEGSRTYFRILEVGYDFMETMKIEMAAGRSYEQGRDQPGRSKMIFNETGIKAMGLEDPIGKIVEVKGVKSEIIGVVKDFHIQTMYEEISPMYIELTDELEYTLIRIRPENLAQTLEGIEKIYSSRLDGVPFDFTFVDSDYDAMYKQEQSISSLSKSFAIVAILISCLGLLGLTAFTAEKRSKEIGIRKVLGAGIWRIMYLLSSQFTKMVLLSLAIGLPISYFIASNWMENFAFGVELKVFNFVLVGMITIGIAWLAVGFQTLKAARANPVDSLRDE